MATNLYDLLEVNQSASQEAIAAGYKRLQAKFVDPAAQGDEDATNHLIALREAHSTLSDPDRRRRYDERLVQRQAEPLATSAQPGGFTRLIVVAAIIGVCGVGYAKYQSDQEKARLERERVVAEAKQAEIQAKREQEEMLAAQQAEQRRLREEAIERANRANDLAYANQVSRNVYHQETLARQQEERQRVSAEREQNYDAARQLAREKAYLRQLESENARNRRY
ncbi:J domain-containing protein [Dechloromonas sp. A34]|uniref:J domain-containing protein n=1 Tax=Dechloromonas sp. A34 TaxID=447588 RepID=UPI002248F022|nr:DnaJ domain-containing protein [Dechloromonas sp. A34]